MSLYTMFLCSQTLGTPATQTNSLDIIDMAWDIKVNGLNMTELIVGYPITILRREIW